VGECATVTFRLTVDDLGFWADGGTRLVEPGDFTLTVGDGTSSSTARLRAEASR
jgi:beta-glucosidase